MERPELFDNQGEATRHGTALEYLFGDAAVEHPLAVATGYVDSAASTGLPPSPTGGRSACC